MGECYLIEEVATKKLFCKKKIKLAGMSQEDKDAAAEEGKLGK